MSGLGEVRVFPQEEASMHSTEDVLEECRSAKHALKVTSVSSEEDLIWHLRKSFSQNSSLASDSSSTSSGSDFIVSSMWFNCGVNFMTMANAVQMGFEADFPEWTHIWAISEPIFTTCFLLEMIIKLCVLKWGYFKDRANWMDGSLTLLAVLDLMLSNLRIGDGANLHSLSILRILRIARLARILKLVRGLKPVVLVIQGVMKAFTTLCYVFLLLMLICYVFAIFFTEHLGKNADVEIYPGYSKLEEEIDAQSFMSNFNPYTCFGSMTLSMMTLFNMATLAEWPEVVRPVALKQPVYVAVFLGFGVLVAFGVMNVMIGLIVDDVITESKKMDDDFMERMLQEKIKTLERIQGILSDMDSNRDGIIDIQELTQAMNNNHEFQELLKSINLPCGWTPTELLHMLDNNSNGSLQLSEFTTGFFRLLESDHFQQICMIQTGINQVKHLVTSGNQIVQGRLSAIEADISSMKIALGMTTDIKKHFAADTSGTQQPCRLEKAILQPTTHSKVATAGTDDVCSELRELLEQVFHKDLKDNLDRAYMALKEGMHLQQSKLSFGFENQFDKVKPKGDVRLPAVHHVESEDHIVGAIEVKYTTTTVRSPCKMSRSPTYAKQGAPSESPIAFKGPFFNSLPGYLNSIDAVDRNSDWNVTDGIRYPQSVLE